MDFKKYEKLGSVSSGYKVSKKNYDIRGWVVIGAQGEKIGNVVDLIFDKDKRIVRYIEVDIEVTFPLAKEKNILIPTEFATVHGENRIVALHQIARPLIVTYPEYSGQEINTDYELLIRDFIAGNINAETEFSKNISVEAGDNYSESVKYQEVLNSTISRLKDERDLAVIERDFALQEKDRLQKELDSIIAGQVQSGEGRVQPFVNCDDFEDGRRC